MSEAATTNAPVATDKAAPQPAPGAEAQKPTPSQGDVPGEAAQETPEQLEEKRKERARAHEQRRLQRRTTEAAEAKAEARLLREENERLRQQQSKPQQQGNAEPKRDGIDPKTGEVYTYEAFVKASAEWAAGQTVDERLKAEREAREGKERQQQAAAGDEKQAKAWAEREATFKATTKDYEEAANAFLDEEIESFSRPARQAIVELGPQLLYHLAKNPEVADAIAALSPVLQVAKLGELQASLPKQAPRTTNAPEPITPSGPRPSGSKKLEDMDQQEYEAERRRRGARYS